MQIKHRGTNMTLSIHHLGLTVNSLEQAQHFFVDLLGWKVVRKDTDYPSLFVSNGHVMITLWKVQTDTFVPFNKGSNVGLHHFAIEVNSEDELNVLCEKFNQSEFEIEFSPEPLRGGPTSHFIVHGPDNIRIEFINVEP